jgi:uncharacterized protein (DUF1330 family)
MAAYIVATVTITDPEKFGDYVKAIAGLSEKHGGEYLVRGKVEQVLEGDVPADQRVVVSRFPTAEAAIAYARSPEYLAGAKLREGAGSVESRLLVDPA